MNENDKNDELNKNPQEPGAMSPGQSIPMVEEGTEVISESLGGAGVVSRDGKLLFVLDNPSMKGTPLPENGQFAIVFVNKEIEPEEEDKGGPGVPIGVPVGGKPLTDDEKDDIADTIAKNGEEQDKEKKGKKALIIGLLLLGLTLTAVGLLKGCSKEEAKYIEEYVVQSTQYSGELIQPENPGKIEHHVIQADGQERLIGERNGYKLYDWQKQAQGEQAAIDTYEQIQDIDNQIADAFEVLKSDDATPEEKSEAWSKLEELNARKLQITTDSKDQILSGVDGFAEASRKTVDERTEEEIALIQSTLDDYDRMVASLEANSDMFEQVAELKEQGYAFDIKITDRPDGDRFLTLDGEKVIKVTKDAKTGETILEEVETPDNMFKDGEGRND